MSATSNAVLAPPSVVSDLSSTSLPYVDIAGENARLKSRILEAVERVLDHGGFVLGREVEEFEARFAEYCGTRFAIGVSNGTAAITRPGNIASPGHSPQTLALVVDTVLPFASIALGMARTAMKWVGVQIDTTQTAVCQAF